MEYDLALGCSNGEKKAAALEGYWGITTELIFSPDGKMIASRSEDAINLRNVEVGIVYAKAED